MDKGIKHDSGKPRWSLIPSGVMLDVIAVLEYGSSKYSDENWKKVDNAKTRYYDAAMRHINAWWDGEDKDTETCISHLAHAICCLMFIHWFDNNDEDLTHSQCKAEIDRLKEIIQKRNHEMGLG